MSPEPLRKAGLLGLLASREALDATFPEIADAAQARCAGAILVTGNEDEFRRVDGLVVENWLRV